MINPENQREVANPFPGTVVDTNITNGYIPEFFLCCQHVNQVRLPPRASLRAVLLYPSLGSLEDMARHAVCPRISLFLMSSKAATSRKGAGQRDPTGCSAGEVGFSTPGCVGGGGRVNRAPQNWWGGLGGGAQLTGPLISYYEFGAEN